MPLISKFKDIFKGGSSAKKKKLFHNVRLDNPEDFWDIVGELGDGAYGKVYKAIHKETKESAALKQVVLEAEEDLETFMIEIDILAECKHENVVELLEAYHFDGKLWMYLEYCDGGAMDSIMVDLDRPLTELQIAYVCKYLCRALVYIHSNKVIHRDLKAGNVLLTMEGGVKLADFGVSAKNKNTYDKRGTFIGTPYWLAPEVILCETFIDAKYDYKADVWSLGISLIEFAQMDPPNHEVSPVRVMLKIQKSDPPKLDYPSRYSKEFNDFIAKCLTKDPVLRPSATELLKHPFIDREVDVKHIRDLLLEYKAEVVEEDVEEDADDQRTSRHSQDDSSQDYTFPVNSATTNKDQETNNKERIEEEKPPSPRKEEKEVVPPVPGERRPSKGPAPSPPVTGSPASTPTSSASSTPSKKGPAPAVPASTISSKPRAPSPVDAPSDGLVADPVVSTPINTSKQVTSTPSGKGPAPKPAPICESPVPKEKPPPTVSMADIPDQKTVPPIVNEPAQNQPIVPPKVEEKKTVEEEKMEVDEKVLVEPHTQKPKKESELDVVDNLSQKNSVSLIQDESSKLKEASPVVNEQTVSEVVTTIPKAASTVTPEPGKVKVNEEKSSDNQQNANSAPLVHSTEFETFPTSPVVYSPIVPSVESQDNRQDIEKKDNFVSDSQVPQVASVPAPVSLSPEPAETIIASIGSEGTVIVRTPTPTPPEPTQSQPVKKESVVTYSGPAIVDEGLQEGGEQQPSVEMIDPMPHTPPPLSPSLSEAEEQAVRILESAIESAVETASNRSSQDEGEEANVTLAGTSVILTPDLVEEEESTVLVSTVQDKEDGVVEVQVITNDGHKLDESEVVISNSSILTNDADSQPEATSKSRYEITLEEVEDVEGVATSAKNVNDTTHISVVAVDDLGETTDLPKQTPTRAQEAPTSLVSEQQANPSSKLPNQNETDNHGHLETSSNISNMSNLSAGTPSTGRSVSSAEEENRPTMSLMIEGTTVGATDVDDDVFDHSEHNESKTPKDNQTRPVLIRESTVESEVSIESGFSTGSTLSTPTHHNIPTRNNTTVAGSPGLKILPNGIGKDNHKLPEKSDWDNVSTASSEKENKPREREEEAAEEVVLRRPPAGDKQDVALKPVDKNRENRAARTKEENDLVALRKKTRKRTRKFVIDGVVVTTTTSKVIYGDDEDGTLSSGHLARKQELRELKILQKQEQKQFQELAVKANFAKIEQEKKFEAEKQQLLRGYDTEVEALNRQQKQQVEKAEAQQEIELKNASKKIRAEQERELKAFRESLKTELKLLKQEIDLLPKDKRKEAFKTRKERLDHEQSEREKAFLERLNEAHEMSLKRLGDDHRERIALLERQFLQQKHQLLRSRESALWEMEERHLHEKHQLAKRQLKDIFFLQRHQMLLRHEKELEQVKRVNQQKEEELIKRQQIEKRQLPKRIRQEMKARELMFRESMRISTTHLPDSHDDEKDKIRKFQENEKRRYEAEKRRAEQKHKHKLEELQAASEYAIKELEQLQNEKRKMLMEHETYKLKSQDEEYQREVREWKENLKPRKQKLEEEFEKQLNEQEQFYGAYLCRGLSASVTPSQSTSSLARSNAS
ncbi:serine/threonine-protein kinase 10-like isoform X3 [Penaeus japonicus]|uniref:serine/threonine-protein kinase 10-like isoform X3 n=1 Tax=Penaeus japonicus TaxID=27405 RepID=UPI001C715155|nr:serine/threonine-protein kinase 10-like isoform X3 [Penaeus japonicus]